MVHSALESVLERCRAQGLGTRVNWLRKKAGHVSQKMSDFDRKGKEFNTAADDVTKYRLVMLMEAGLLETPKIGNWEFSGFNNALEYFDGVNIAISDLSIRAGRGRRVGYSIRPPR